MEQRRFHNALRILLNLDRSDLEAAGVIAAADHNAWGTFHRDPFRFFIWADDATADGAVFVFVQSTASVALLLLESRPTRDGRRWHSAFASLVSGPVVVRHGGKEVASIEKDYSSADRTKPYLQLHGQPVPKE